MRPFVINGRDRLVFPSNFIAELDFSVLGTLDQLGAVIRRDFEAKAPTGSVPIHMPNTMAVIGSVASPLSGASTAPTMLAVLTMTVLLPPASACATASTKALRRASASSMCACRIGSAIADMRGPGKATPFSGDTPYSLLQ